MNDQKGQLTVTMEELQEMLLQGKISTEQFISILRQNLGDEEVEKLLKDTIEKTYSKNLLSAPAPKSLIAMVTPSLDKRLSKKPNDRKT